MAIFIGERQFAVPTGFAWTAAATFVLFFVVVFVLRTFFFWLRYILNGRDLSIAYTKFRHTDNVRG